MDGHKLEGLSDEALEREIESALGVDPSPEFLPRVRTRIANERMHEGWVWSWRWAGTGVAVIAVAIIGLWVSTRPVPAPREARVFNGPSNSGGVGGEARTTDPGTRIPDPGQGSVADPGVREAHARRRIAAKQPEVLISQDEAIALRQLVMAIAARQVEAVDIPKLGVESAPLPPIEEIVLEPIKLSPLNGLDSE